MEKVSTSLPKLSQLEELYASGNEFKTADEFQTHYPVLEVLDLRQNKLEGVESLRPLCNLETLNELLLESNPICSGLEKYVVPI